MYYCNIQKVSICDLQQAYCLSNITVCPHAWEVADSAANNGYLAAFATHHSGPTWAYVQRDKLVMLQWSGLWDLLSFQTLCSEIGDKTKV